MSDIMKEEWLVWKIILSGKASLTELKTTYSYDDMLRLSAAIDIQNDIEMSEYNVDSTDNISKRTM